MGCFFMSKYDVFVEIMSDFVNWVEEMGKRRYFVMGYYYIIEIKRGVFLWQKQKCLFHQLVMTYQ